MTVVAAIELDNLVAFGESACKTNSGHRGLGTRIAHPNLLNTWHERTNQLRHRDFEWIRNPKARAVFGGLLHRLDDFRMRVAQDRRTPRPDVVHVIISINVPNACSFGFIDKKRLPSHSSKRADRRIDSARNIFQRLAKKLLRLLPRNHCSKSVNHSDKVAADGRRRTQVLTSLSASLRRRYVLAIAAAGLSQYLCAIGILRPIPNALLVTFKPGAAWRRLYSFKSIKRMTLRTVSSSKPDSTISELDFPCTT